MGQLSQRKKGGSYSACSRASSSFRYLVQGTWVARVCTCRASHAMGNILESPFGARGSVQPHFRSSFQGRWGMTFMPHWHPPSPVHLLSGMDLGWESGMLSVHPGRGGQEFCSWAEWPETSRSPSYVPSPCPLATGCLSRLW